MSKLDNLKIKIFADGADFKGMTDVANNPLVKGFTTNPSLMRKAGIKDYESFGRKVAEAFPDKPISLEVFADDFNEMEKQAKYISSWGKNINVKIPVTNTKGEFAGSLISNLSNAGVKLNITAIMTANQVSNVANHLNKNVPAIISVFAGRIADTAIDPIPVMQESMDILAPFEKFELLWASPREPLNIFQADDIGCHIITITNSMLDKLNLVGKDLNLYSQETVQMFFNDALDVGYQINTSNIKPIERKPVEELI